VIGTTYFCGQRRSGPLSGIAMFKVVQRMGWNEETTVHGMRAVLKTWASERTNFPREVVEAALAHIMGDQVEQAYQRGDYLR